MADKSLFRSIVGRLRAADTQNRAGGPAYARTDEQALAQFAATGCLAGTFYASGEQHLGEVLSIAMRCEPEFVARVAVFARRHARMKDMPALLCAVLAVRDGELLERVFAQVVDNARMLRSFVQIVRSGRVGRRSLGTRPRRLVRDWLAQRSDTQLLHASLGANPSMRDIVRMVHPKPADPTRANFYAWLLGRPFDFELLQGPVRELERFRRDGGALPDVNFQLLSHLPLDSDHWRTIARRASWTNLRMNLNTYRRHGVFDCDETVAVVARRLADPTEVGAAKAFPYQIMTTLLHLDDAVPDAVRTALARALELATDNVPELPGRTVVAIDVSGSMHAPISGYRKGSTSKATCLDAAAVLAAAVLRRNPSARVIAFHEQVVRTTIDPAAPIADIVQTLRGLPCGGTDCAAALALLNRERARADTVVIVSDNVSWFRADRYGNSTGMLAEWRRFAKRNRDAQLVCLDIQPSSTAQAPEDDGVTNVGGFSDQVFDVLRTIAARENTQDHFVRRIREVAI